MDLREDGRKFNEVRRINSKINFLDGCDGSAIFELGNTKVDCIIIGSCHAPRTNRSPRMANRQHREPGRPSYQISCNISARALLFRSKMAGFIRKTHARYLQSVGKNLPLHHFQRFLSKISFTCRYCGILEI